MSQVIEFFAAPGQTVTAQLYSAGSDTLVSSQSATEATNRKGVYTATYTGVAAGTYRVLALVGSTPIATWWVNLLAGSATYIAYEMPVSEIATAVAATQALSRLDSMIESDGAGQFRFDSIALSMVAGGGGGGGDASQATLLLVKAKTDLISAGTVQVNSPVAASGSLRPIVIGDDYLAANGRAFVWTIPAIAGITPGTATAYFGGTSTGDPTHAFLVTGTVTDIGSGKWSVSCDMPRAISSGLLEQQYEWTLGIQASGGNRVTPVRWGERVQCVESHTW